MNFSQLLFDLDDFSSHSHWFTIFAIMTQAAQHYWSLKVTYSIKWNPFKAVVFNLLWPFVNLVHGPLPRKCIWTQKLNFCTQWIYIIRLNERKLLLCQKVNLNKMIILWSFLFLFYQTISNSLKPTLGSLWGSWLQVRNPWLRVLLQKNIRLSKEHRIVQKFEILDPTIQLI